MTHFVLARFPSTKTPNTITGRRVNPEGRGRNDTTCTGYRSALTSGL